MLIEHGGKTYTITHKFNQWKAFQKDITRLGLANDNASPMERAQANDSIIDASSAYMIEHLSAAHIPNPDEPGKLMPDPEWTPGTGVEEMDPGDALALIGKAASPTESPFA